MRFPIKKYQFGRLSQIYASLRDLIKRDLESQIWPQSGPQCTVKLVNWERFVFPIFLLCLGWGQGVNNVCLGVGLRMKQFPPCSKTLNICSSPYGTNGIELQSAMIFLLSQTADEVKPYRGSI